MKKLISLLTLFILLFSIFSTVEANSKMNVYAPDGRVEVINTSDFNAWHAVGWYSAPVMYVYSLDGRTQLILTSDFSQWQAVGWYSAPMMYVYSADGRTELIPKADYYAWNSVGWYSDTPIMVYAPDGRSQYIPKNEFSQWKSAGWYSAPVMYMYAPDGRVQLILKSELSKWQKSGWYTKPVVTIYSGSKSKVVPMEDYKSWQQSGWFRYVKLYNTFGDTISVASDEVWDYSPYWRVSLFDFNNNMSLSKIEWSPNGTNFSLEQAKEIVRKYARSNFYYYDYTKQEFNKMYGYGWWDRTDDISLASYSDTAYLISAGFWDGEELISVNKTTGYVFYVGGGNAGYMPNIMNPF